MAEFKGTKGKWYVERTSKEDGDFQARILSNLGKEYHAGELKDKVYIIAGEPQKINGQSNIHSKANALLISKSPEMLEMLEKAKSLLGNVGEFDIATEIEQLIKEATEI